MKVEEFERSLEEIGALPGFEDGGIRSISVRLSGDHIEVRSQVTPLVIMSDSREVPDYTRNTSLVDRLRDFFARRNDPDRVVDYKRNPGNWSDERYASGEVVAELPIEDIDIPDDYIDEKIKLAISKERVGYLQSVKLVGIGASGIYEVVEDYSYNVHYQAVGRRLSYNQLTEIYSEFGNEVPHLTTVTARKGFQFDRASIPRIIWPIISKDDLSNVPPLFHDLLYRYGGKLPKNNLNPYTRFTRREADNLFVYLMRQSGVTEWRALLAGQAVKRFSGFAWKGK